MQKKTYSIGLAVGLVSWLAIAACKKSAAPAVSSKAEIVIVLHGIMNKPFVMDEIARALREQGYEVYNWGYPSREGLIDEHATRLRQFIDGLPKNRKINFVGYSQGAIIIRYMLTHHPVTHAGRFVMIAPPNHGCEMAQDFYEYAWFRGLYKEKSIKQLFARQNEFLDQCGIPPVEFGIIAGGKGDGKGYFERIPGDDDGTVSVASARLDGAKDFIVLPHKHVSIIWHTDTIRQMLSFLKEGHFQHAR
jgi:pimeloyl-ACP methyl ester carboxylesterase